MGRIFPFALGVVAAACSSAPETKQLSEAESLCLDQRYEEAIPVLRRVLLDEPLNAGAHFYLGMAYLGAEKFLPELSKGEFETALRLFKNQGGQSPIDRYADDYFEMMCHVYQGKVVYRDGLDKLSIGARVRHIEGHLAELKGLAKAARAAMPEAEEPDTLDEYAALLLAAAKGGNNQMPSKAEGER